MQEQTKDGTADVQTMMNNIVDTNYDGPDGRATLFGDLMDAGILPSGQPFFKSEVVYDSFRSAEYDIRTALAEPLDNGVEAGCKDLWLFIKTEKKAFRGKNLDVISEVAVVDNGDGMSVDTVRKCLVLGDSVRPIKPNGRGIGRFGVGLTMGGISVARRIEVYSRADKSGPFYYTYLDLNAIKKKQQTAIPDPVEMAPPAEYQNLLKDSTGTIILLKDCDRLQFDPAEHEKGLTATEQIKDLPQFLGRTYRKFIAGGMNLWFNGNKVFLHDPLYLLGPTRHEIGKTEPKAIMWGKPTPISLEVPGAPGTKADVIVTMSLLPAEWRKVAGAGDSTFNRERGIPDNQGISILRADREVLYGSVPYIIGKKGQAKSKEIDRFWGCEISFPPELDDYFHVRFIKRGAEPVTSLRDKIRELIDPSVDSLRKQIQADFQKEAENADKENGVFQEAEKAMAEADRTMPSGKRGAFDKPEEVETKLDELVEEAVAVPGESKEEKRQQLAAKPYSIVAVQYPRSIFFETVHMPGRIVVKLNVNHPFYKNVFEPLCGSIATMDENSDADQGADTPEKRMARRALMLLLLSYAKAESMFDAKNSATLSDGQEDLFENLRAYWGTSLATVLAQVGKE